MEHSPRYTMFWAIIHTLTKFKKTEITLCMLSVNNGIKLEISNRKLENP